MPEGTAGLQRVDGFSLAMCNTPIPLTPVSRCTLLGIPECLAGNELLSVSQRGSVVFVLV